MNGMDVVQSQNTEDFTMGMTIANNTNAIGIQRTLNASNASLSGSLEKLSSGFKINTGKDDPSGLVISELLRSQSNGIARAVQNTQEANNVLSIAEGALSEMNNILTKMKQLAIHAANNGITSNEQVAADQAEIDSSIQTLDRIARTTTYSDENLLNGSKEINFDTTVLVKDSMDMAMIDKGLTNIQQIFKRDDFQLNVSFSGKNAFGDDNGNGAKKAYFEITTTTEGAEATQVKGGSNDTDSYTLTHDQAFTISGNAGSRTLSFAKGTHLGEMASSINSVVDSTGVKATLIFDQNAAGTKVLKTGATSATWANTNNLDFGTVGAATDGTNIRAFNTDASGERTASAGVSKISISTAGADKMEIGVNLDGDGRMYLRMVTNQKYEIYKDAAMTMKVGSGSVAANDTDSMVIASNNSKIEGLTLQFKGYNAGFKAGSTSVLQFANMLEDVNATDGYAAGSSVNFKSLASSMDASLGGSNMDNSFLSGVKLGYNTSDTGQLYVKATLDYASGEANSQIKVYKDAQMRDEDLVASSVKFDAANIATGGGVNIYAAQIGDSGQDTGLYGVINLGDKGTNTKVEVASATISFDNLGLRVSAAEYGSDQFVKIHATEGAVWTRYDSSNNAVLLDAGLSGTEWTNYGSDAHLALNGQEITLNGIHGTLTNLDATSQIAFNQGSVGNTTIATVGYDEGSIAAKAHELGNVKNQALNALHTTTEIIGDFSGGMQFQLGEGSGDQNRTVYSIQDITATELGKMKFYDYFEDGSKFKTEKYLAINDMMSGGAASLANDPVKAMAIITEAIKDVSDLRATIGAFQANMLETNANSLKVAMENIDKTESYIRDTDMATESTEFTKNQVLVQAGTSMLAQANQLTQSAMSLIGG